MYIYAPVSSVRILSQMIYVLLAHVRVCAPLYQFRCTFLSVIVTKKPVRGFWGLGDSQEPHSDRYKTGGEKVNF